MLLLFQYTKVQLVHIPSPKPIYFAHLFGLQDSVHMTSVPTVALVHSKYSLLKGVNKRKNGLVQHTVDP